MKKIFLFIIANLILVTLQNSFFSEFFGLANPNLIIALAYMFVLLDSDESAYISLFIGGLFLDLLSLNIVGLGTFSLLLVLFGSVLFRRTVFKGTLVQLVFIMLSVFVQRVVSGLSIEVELKSTLLAGITTIVITYAFYIMLNSFKHRYKSSEYRIRA